MQDITREEENVIIQGTIRRLRNDGRLNDWEMEFLDNVSERIQRVDLSAKQMGILNGLKNKYLANK